MDKNTGACKYAHSVSTERRKLTDIALLPSEKIAQEMHENNESFLEFGVRYATANSEKFPQEDFAYDKKRLRRA